MINKQQQKLQELWKLKAIKKEVRKKAYAPKMWNDEIILLFFLKITNLNVTT